MKFFDTQKTKRGNKLVRTYYDSEQVKQEKGKVSELIPTFKPLQPKKKEKFEILQLNS